MDGSLIKHNLYFVDIMDETQTYYTIEILITNRLRIHGSSFVEYRGENICYDWWNY